MNETVSTYIVAGITVMAAAAAPIVPVLPTHIQVYVGAAMSGLLAAGAALQKLGGGSASVTPAVAVPKEPKAAPASVADPAG